MSALPEHVRLLQTPPRRTVSADALAECVRALDPGSRALLDLSLRRRLPFEAMAGVLHTDPFDLARRRARAVARIAAELDLEGAGVVATVKAALARLPDEAWGVPVAKPAPAVQAEAMAAAARALMEKLAAQREVMARATETETGAQDRPGSEPDEQPTVETEAIVLPPEPAPAAQAWPAVAASPMAAAFSHHPAFAIEREDEAAALPPLAQALARAAESERAAAEAKEETVVPPAPEPVPAPTAAGRPAPPLADPPPGEREPRRRLARGGLLVGLLLAMLRLLFGRR